METGNKIVDLTFSFALDIIEFSELLEEKRKYIIGRQLLKSGTSIGAMYGKHKIAKVKLILSTNSKLPLKKPKKQSIGYCFANMPRVIRLTKVY